MSSSLFQTKSMLAKLLAGENLNVVHEKISTAFFDLKSRTLHLPIWEVMDGDLYDLLVGHEDGHALYTPQEGWHNAITEHGRQFKSVLNVIEDARIEKIIKRKYPGLSRSFANGYRDLFERDFFGIKRIPDISKLNIIDRINLYFKVGSHLIVPFSDAERELVKDVANLETWEQVVEVAKRVHEHAKKEKDKIKNMDDLSQVIHGFPEGDESEDMEFEYSESDEGEEPGDSSPEPTESIKDDSGEEKSEDGNLDSEDAEQGDSDSSSEEEGEEETEEPGSGNSEEELDGDSSDESEESTLNGDSSEEDDEDEDGESAEGSTEATNNEDVESVTDSVFRQRESELVVGDTEVYTYTLPEPHLDNIIIPNAIVHKFFHTKLDMLNTYKYPIIQTCVNEFLKTNNRYISMLLKEFEMRKNASQYARTTVARTGELDMSKLHSYKFTNDIFRKVSVVPKGKSHGMVMFVDMSGSMGGIFGPTIEQVLILATFCKKAGIPFDVYGFSDANYSNDKMLSEGYIGQNYRLSEKFRVVPSERVSVSGTKFTLRHLIGSDLKATDYRQSFGMLCAVALDFPNKFPKNYKLSLSEVGFDLGGTPFVQTLLASRKIIENFNSKHKVDITNVIYLTDGEGNSAIKFNAMPPVPYPPTNKVRRKVYLIDSKTKQRCEFAHSHKQQAPLTEFVRRLTGCKHVGFYIAERRQLSGKLTEVVNQMTDHKKRLATSTCLREYGYFAGTNLGYDNYYYVVSKKSNVQDDELEIDSSMTARKMTHEFKKVQNSKKKNRMLISRFTEEIAKV